jgi:hypothetical protein
MEARRALVLAAVVPLLALAAVGSPARPALADDVVCEGTVPPLVRGNLVVPSGATCVLAGHSITGNVFVRPDARLSAEGIRVGGNVQAEGPVAVSIRSGSIISGDVQAIKGTGSEVELLDSLLRGDVELTDNHQGRVSVEFNTVQGNLKVEKSSADLFEIRRNFVEGDLQFFTNTGPSEILGNTVAGNLQCKENAPPPVAAANLVVGSAEEQCAEAEMEPAP